MRWTASVPFESESILNRIIRLLLPNKDALKKIYQIILTIGSCGLNSTFFKIFFLIYSFEREKERHRQGRGHIWGERQREEGEADSP